MRALSDGEAVIDKPVAGITSENGKVIAKCHKCGTSVVIGTVGVDGFAADIYGNAQHWVSNHRAECRYKEKKNEM